jgi:cytochrome c oxidase cbb3-type subunit 2
MERLNTILFVAGVVFFVFAFAVMGIVPWLHFRDLPIQKVEELLDPLMPAFEDLAKREPEAFAKAFPEGPTRENAAAALREGRKVYVGEGCWHCHSQFVRPVSNENVRFGLISAPAEYQNELQLPPLFGTRRVGPDLSREAGLRSNDWHIAHFQAPREVAPVTVMPPYSWLYDLSGERPVPNRKGFALITFVQWIGSWVPEEQRIDGAYP